MKEIAQRPADGTIGVEDVPTPALRAGWILIRNQYSLISVGTERTKVEFGGKSIVAKARSRPDLVKKVVDRARIEGVRSAIGAARDRLAELVPLGYSSAGIVDSVGTGVEGVSPGDRVACAGAGWANHAEIVAVPKNLVARVPEGVDLADAAYATVGAIALHAVHQSDARVGERIGVVGLGLVGQLAVRILRAAGCDVVGVDLDPTAIALAEKGGATAFRRDLPALEAAVVEAAGGVGLDAVLVCAASSSSDPLELAAQLARERGRLVVVGDVPVSLSRRLMYEKELELKLSRSYGPGRYDREYEERGRDLPIAYVRWTEQRNLQAFVDLVATGRIAPRELTTHRFTIDRAAEAFALLETKSDSAERPFGVLLEYPERPAEERKPPATGRAPKRSGARIGVIGAGSFARRTLIPALKRTNADLAAVVTERGLAAGDVASRHGFERAAASTTEILEDDSIDGVVIATRHGTHAELAAAALRAGKNVFVEKPLALTREELLDVEAALAEGGVLMVGFNRRFAPLTERLLQAIAGAPHLALVARVNAGPLADDHWLHDPVEGGGRLVGEGCHFVDLLAHLAGSVATSAYAVASPQPTRPLECSDSAVGSLRFASGAVGSIVYSGGGDPALPKERIEAFGGGVAAVLDDFRRLEIRHGKRSVVKSGQDKGHTAEIRRFVAAVSGQEAPPPVEGYLASTRATLALAESLRTGLPVALT